MVLNVDDDGDYDDGDDGDEDDDDSSFRAVTGRKAWVAPVCLSLAPRAQFAPFTEDDQLQVLRKCVLRMADNSRIYWCSIVQLQYKNKI